MRPYRWTTYRLSDMVRAKQFRNCPRRGKAHHLLYYPDTIASRYMKETEESNNFPLIAKIVSRSPAKIGGPLNDNHYAVHLRVGDVIDDSPQQFQEFVESTQLFRNGYNYVKPLSYFQEQFSPTNNNCTITLVCGGCYLRPMHGDWKSRAYISAIASWFRAHPKVSLVRIRYGNPPDDDFVFLCRAPNFISSGGGFSRLVTKVREVLASNRKG